VLHAAGVRPHKEGLRGAILLGGDGDGDGENVMNEWPKGDKNTKQRLTAALRVLPPLDPP
jgi:hypothetical protein